MGYSVSQKPAPLKVGFKLPGCSNWRLKRHIPSGPCEPGCSIPPDHNPGAAISVTKPPRDRNKIACETKTQMNTSTAKAEMAELP